MESTGAPTELDETEAIRHDREFDNFWKPIENLNETLLESELKKLIHNAKENASSRKKRKRGDAGETTIDWKLLRTRWHLNDGKCLVSNIPMRLKGPHWRVSLDRIRNDRGYHADNVRLICREFNYSQTMTTVSDHQTNIAIPWIPTKFEYLIKRVLLEDSSQEEEETFSDNVERTSKMLKNERYKRIYLPAKALQLKDRNLLLSASCRNCREIKPVNSFYYNQGSWHNLGSKCIPCENQHRYDLNAGKVQSTRTKRTQYFQEGKLALKCLGCQNVLPAENFGYHRGVPSERKSRCRACEATRYNDFPFRLKAIILRCRNRKNACTKTARPKFLHPDITVEDALALYVAQKGRCYYSGIFMRTESHKDWLMSLERKDPSRGYSKDNCVWICKEFNTRAQWSKEKMQYVLSCQ